MTLILPVLGGDDFWFGSQTDITSLKDIVGWYRIHTYQWLFKHVIKSKIGCNCMKKSVLRSKVFSS